MMLIQVPEKLQQMLLPKTDAGAIAAYLTSPILTAALVAGVAYILNRYLPVIYGLLTGDRGKPKQQTLTLNQN